MLKISDQVDFGEDHIVIASAANFGDELRRFFRHFPFGESMLNFNHDECERSGWGK